MSTKTTFSASIVGKEMFQRNLDGYNSLFFRPQYFYNLGEVKNQNNVIGKCCIKLIAS